jgi:hypothetical protein
VFGTESEAHPGVKKLHPVGTGAGRWSSSPSHPGCQERGRLPHRGHR